MDFVTIDGHEEVLTVARRRFRTMSGYRLSLLSHGVRYEQSVSK